MISTWLSLGRGLIAGALLCAAVQGSAHADVLLDEVAVIGLPAAPAPSEFSFSTTTAQALTVTLTDFQAPAVFGSLQIAVTQGDALVGSASVDGTTSATVATVNLPAAIANYTLHVIGTPDATQGIGSFGVCVALQATPQACIAGDSFSGNIQVSTPPSSNNTSTVNTNFTSTVAGSYTITLSDDAFPAPLSSLSTAVFDGGTLVGGPFQAGAPTQLTLAAGTSYQLLIAAAVGTAAPAGLYGIQITDPTGAVVFARTVPVGELASSTLVTNPSAQTLSLSITDLGYPAALSGIGAAVTSGAALLAPPLTSSGSENLTAPKGSLELWQYTVAGAQPGSYTLSLASSPTTSLYSATEVVNSGDTVSATSFAFVANLPAAGTYNLIVTDYQFPASLGSLTYTVAQNGTVIAVNGSGDFTVSAAGTVIVVVDATPAQGTIGIFGVTVSSTGAAPTVLLDTTQAVGGVFNSRTVSLGSSGNYDVTLTDLVFPTKFTDLAVIVTQNGQSFGKIYAEGGTGTFPVSATPGQYVLTYVATPGAQNYGLFALSMSTAPPTVTLTVNPTTVPAGQSVQVSWSSAGATSCSAGGTAAFSGSEPLSSTDITVAIPATATLTLSCEGPGGTTAATPVTVTATTAVSSSGGGGGALDLDWLVVLALLAGARAGHVLRRRSARAQFSIA
jgi:hypothetical protein